MASRRVLIKYIALGSAGFALLPYCTISNETVSEDAKKLGLTAHEALTLGILCNALIPFKAKDNTVEKPDLAGFVLKMVNDCYSPEVQQQFVSGLQQFTEKVKQDTGIDANKTDTKTIAPVLIQMEASQYNTGSIAEFYKLTKSLTIKAYKGSKYYLTQVQPFVQVPGKYEGCVTV